MAIYPDILNIVYDTHNDHLKPDCEMPTQVQELTAGSQLAALVMEAVATSGVGLTKGKHTGVYSEFMYLCPSPPAPSPSATR